MVVVNPLDKPVIGFEESPEFVETKRRWKSNREFDKIVAHRGIRNCDLSLVDKSDIIIVKLDMSERPCGTFEELFWANRMKRPVLVWVEGGLTNCPDWLFWTLPLEHLFDTCENLLKYLSDIDNGIKDHKRFIFLDHSKLI